MAKFFMTDEGKSDVTEGLAVRRVALFVLRSDPSTASGSIYLFVDDTLRADQLSCYRSLSISSEARAFVAFFAGCQRFSSLRRSNGRKEHEESRRNHKDTQHTHHLDIYLPQSRVGVKGKRGAKVYLDY